MPEVKGVPSAGWRVEASKTSVPSQGTTAIASRMAYPPMVEGLSEHHGMLKVILMPFAG